MSKLHVEHHIEVKLYMDEMDLAEVESKAIYEELNGYELERS